jgi:hypothetical protein
LMTCAAHHPTWRRHSHPRRSATINGSTAAEVERKKGQKEMQRTGRAWVVRLAPILDRTRIAEAVCNILVCGAVNWSAISVCIRRDRSVLIFCAGVAGRASAIIEALFPITRKAAITRTIPNASIRVQTRIRIPTITVATTSITGGPFAFPIRSPAVAPTGSRVGSTIMACHQATSAAYTIGPLAADTFGSQRDDQHCSSRCHPLHGS